MKKNLQKLILISAIAVVMVTNQAKGQNVVSANCKTFVLTRARIEYLKRFADPVINRAIDTCATIKNNSTADVIVAILSLPKAPKTKELLLTSK